MENQQRVQINRECGKQRKDRGASGRGLGYLTMRTACDSIFIQARESHLVFSSPLACPFLVAVSCLCTVHLFLCWEVLQGVIDSLTWYLRDFYNLKQISFGAL